MEKKVHLMQFIKTLEKKIGSKIKKSYLPMQMGDVRQTLSDVSKLNKLTGYKSKTNVSEVYQISLIGIMNILKKKFRLKNENQIYRFVKKKIMLKILVFNGTFSVKHR